jgi:intracellular sulfur oxidation DsrE/DsrF family protein
MKKFIALCIVNCALCIICFAQKQGGKAPYNVVMDITSADTVVHQMAMRWVKEIVQADPSAQVELVFYGKGLGMITQGKSTVADTLMKYATMKNVSFKVCQVAMKSNNVDKGMLLTGVGTVPDGIYEVISKQHEGWGYIKPAR